MFTLQLVAKVTDLQAQISEAKQVGGTTATRASDYEKQLSSLQALHDQCRADAESLHTLLDAKETELSRMMTTLQVAAAQISALNQPKGDDETRPLPCVSEEVCRV